MRIVRTRYKVLYLLGVGVIGYAVNTLASSVDSSGLLVNVLVILENAFSVIAVRSFRVPEEDIAAPRPWWRMTGRPTAGFVLGSLYGIAAVVGFVVPVVRPVPSGQSPQDVVANTPFFLVLSTLISLGWAVLYLRSSRRLAQVGGPAVDFPADPVGFGDDHRHEGR